MKYDNTGIFFNLVLCSSLQPGGSVIKYSENRARQQWLKEPPETLLSMLKDADLSLAFETYTIYRPGNVRQLSDHENTLAFKNIR